MVTVVPAPSDVYVETASEIQPDAASAVLVAPDGSRTNLSPSTYSLFERILQQLQRGGGIQVVVYDRDLTTQQAADMLNVSRQYLVRILETGTMPFHKVGTHRRVRLVDVLEYYDKRRGGRRQSLARLTQASERMGDYDDQTT